MMNRCSGMDASSSHIGLVASGEIASQHAKNFIVEDGDDPGCEPPMEHGAGTGRKISLTCRSLRLYAS